MANWFTRVADGLGNALTGAGTGADKQSYNRWSYNAADVCTPQEAEAAYRTSWLARKIHDLPPFDMTREWRDWQAEDTDISNLEKEEDRLEVRSKVRQALIVSRIQGGAGLVMGGLPGDPAMPVNISALKAGDLKYLHVASRYQLTVSDINRDVMSPFFGQPLFYEMTGGDRQVRIHPSRVIPFVPSSIPPMLLQFGQSLSLIWGDPLWQTIRDAITNATLTHEGIAALIQEAKVDTISFPKLMDNVATAEGEARLMRRLTVANLAKSLHNTLVIDSEEKWETRQINFTNLPEVLNAFLQVVAGAADIPLTRLLGTAPKGLNATGESDAANYDLMIRAKQESDLRPLLSRLDEVLVPSALGSTPDDVYWEFAPLSQLTELERATMGKTKAETTQIYVNSGLLPDKALATAVQNQLVEDGAYPGLEAALAEAEAAGDLASILEEPTVDPNALTMGPDGKPLAPANPQVQPPKPPVKTAANDAEPRTLYVSRKVTNAADIVTWAKGQGIPDLEGDLHVTIAYSRTPIDWIATAEDWGGANDKGEIILPPGGPRVVEPLGEMTAVLMFGAWQLQYRHERILAAGASWDWEGYQPHISLTKAPLDVSKVTPYQGRIVLGPEIYEELKPDGNPGDA